MKITVRVSNRNEMLDFLSKMSQKLRTPDTRKSVNAVGRYWLDNFRGEGREVGGWAALSQRTIENRAAQGYGSGPILYRYGSLFRTATYPAEVTRSGSRSGGTPYDPRNHVTTATVRFKAGAAELQLSGVKVYNNWDDSRTGRPARPIWWSDAAVGYKARDGAIQWLVEDVIHGSGY